MVEYRIAWAGVATIYEGLEVHKRHLVARIGCEREPGVTAEIHADPPRVKESAPTSADMGRVPFSSRSVPRVARAGIIAAYASHANSPNVINESCVRRAGRCDERCGEAQRREDGDDLEWESGTS